MNYYPFHIGDYCAHTRHLSLMEDLAYRRLLDAYYLNEGPLRGTVREIAREIGMLDHIESVEYVLGRFFERQDDAWRSSRCDEEIAKYRRMTEGGRSGASKRWSKREDVQMRPDEGPQAAERKSDAKVMPTTDDGHMPANLAGSGQPVAQAWGGDTPPIAPPMPTKNQEPRTNNHTPPSPPSGGRAGSGFAQQVLLCEPPPLETNQGKSRVEPLPAEPPGFAGFWKAWPSNHRKAARGKCLQVWLRIKAERHADAILAHVERMKQTEDWRKAGGQFVPAPLVYLNQRRWEGSPVDEEPEAVECGEYAGAI